MLPILIAAGAIALMASGCKSQKEDPEESVPFIKTKDNTYWADLDVDGRQSSRETIMVKPGQDKDLIAKKFIKQNSWAFSPCFRWQPKFFPPPIEDFFPHPQKYLLEKNLKNDLRALKRMEDPPEIFKQLRGDLEMMLEELPHVHFRDPTEEELKHIKTSAGYLALYLVDSNEIAAIPGTPASLMIHEMDHRLTAHRRVEKWSHSYREKCESGEIREVPQAPFLPGPTEGKTGFEFSLDFFGTGKNRLTYQDPDYWDAFYRSVELGANACYSEAAKAAALANEVRAYQTMARYLLFKIGFTEKEIQAIRSGEAEQSSPARPKLARGLQARMEGSSLNPRWVHQMMLHYFGMGGANQKANLTTFVQDYYQQIGDPGFIDPPDCVK